MNMKKILFAVAMMTLASVSVFAKNDWRGKVIDEKGEPVAYANVAVLSKADSTVVCGTVTEEDGTFNIVTKESDGFGFNFTASDAQSLRRADFNDPVANLNMNYRTGGVDIFAGVNYGTRNFLQLSDAEKETTGSPVFKDQATIDAAETDRNLGGNAGINWQIADNHFMGGKVEWGRELSVSGRTIIHDKVTRDGELMDDITTITEDTLGEKAPFNVGTNFYYNGTVGGKPV